VRIGCHKLSSDLAQRLKVALLFDLVPGIHSPPHHRVRCEAVSVGLVPFVKPRDRRFVALKDESDSSSRRNAVLKRHSEVRRVEVSHFGLVPKRVDLFQPSEDGRHGHDERVSRFFVHRTFLSLAADYQIEAFNAFRPYQFCCAIRNDRIIGRE
jgi:hypothetical protein